MQFSGNIEWHIQKTGHVSFFFLLIATCYILLLIKKIRNRFQVKKRLLFKLKSISDTLFNVNIFIAKENIAEN